MTKAKYKNGLQKWFEEKRNKNSNSIKIEPNEMQSKLCEYNITEKSEWDNNKSNKIDQCYLNAGYIVHEDNSNALNFVLDDNTASNFLNIKITPAQKVYLTFKINATSKFYKKINFCTHYFKSAVKHFYDTPAESKRTTCNGKKIEAETRYNSWVQCYKFFKILKKNHPNGIDKDHHSVDEACVRLGFYMASWGMYRGSSFLLQNDYNIYKEIVPILLNSKYDDLWLLDKKINDLIKNEDSITIVDSKIDSWAGLIMELATKIRIQLCPYRKYYIEKSYFSDHPAKTSYTSVSKTLITKLLLGTVGCYPALDRYFSEAIGSVANDLDEDQIKCMLALAYCVKKDMISSKINFELANDGDNVALPLSDYPIMKLIDMYYFTFGMEKPFLDLINKIITGKKTISDIANENTNNNRKLLKQFILYDNGSPKVDIAFPCLPLNVNSIVCTYTLLDICNIAKTGPSNSSAINYGNIINKLTDKKGDLYKKISTIKDKDDEETES